MKKIAEMCFVFFIVSLIFSCNSHAEVDNKIKKEKNIRKYVCDELCKNISLVNFVFDNSTNIDISTIVSTPEKVLRKHTDKIIGMKPVEIRHMVLGNDGLKNIKNFSVTKDTIMVKFHVKKSESVEKIEVDILMITAFTVHKDEKFCSDVNALACISDIFTHTVNEVVAPQYLSELPELQP
ncbi:MAG: hypothetical protein EOO52_10150 [Gammaproteobacteria bacterium]|nr:MAG: hypothetical protein EOO52_10150 [Gammaproteobacteria bacterium]